MAARNDKRDRYATPAEPAQTLKMLNHGYIDVNLENNENLKTAFEVTGLNPANFITFVAKSKPVGLYFGKQFLQREPGFLNKFNSSLEQCKQ